MEPTFLERYHWKERVKIGSGSFSIVYKVKRKESDQQVAIKQIDMANFKDKNFRQGLGIEIQLMKNLKSDYIVCLYDSFMDSQSTYLAMELCQSDLRKKLNANSGKLKEQQSIYVFTHIIRGFKQLINLGYIHRDVKPQNILTRGQHYKIADFGFSCKADMNYIHKLDLVCGTPLYMAPQILNEQAYTAKCDIWSLGIMLYEMVFGYGPWVCRNIDSYRFNILNKPLSFPYNGKIGENTKDLIKKCLVIKEEKRIGWKELFAHPLVQDKQPGDIVKPLQISKTAVDVMRRIQESAARKSISILNAFKLRKIDKVNIRQFQEICKSLDPTVTSFEIRVLFSAIDTSKDEYISYEEFTKMILENDFRQVNDVASRYIGELIEMIKFRKIQVGSVFKGYDRNSSGTIDFVEFTKLVRQFLPRMPQSQIKTLFNRFDRDKSGDISLKEFQFELTYGVIPQNNEKLLKSQKAVRCLSALKAAIKYYEIDQSDIMKVFDTNKDNRIDQKQFCNMVFSIDKYLPEQQLKLMFDYIDNDKQGTINHSELKACFT